MVRDYNKEDIDVLIELFDLHNELSEAEERDKRKELDEGEKVVVFEENGDIKGMCALNFWNNVEIGSCAEAIVSIKEEGNFKEIANKLWEAIQDLLIEKNVVMIKTHYNEKNASLSEFYSEKQFKPWFGIHGMIYKGGDFEETKLTFRNYKESDFDKYYTNLGKCFEPMRKANDIRPYDVFKGSSPEKIDNLKKEMLEIKADTYLFFDGEELVGSSILKHEEIDDLFVVPEFQGKGYGRKIMEATLNLILQRKFKKITLGVVAWNTVGYNLYKSLGFEVYQTFAHRRLLLKAEGK